MKDYVSDKSKEDSQLSNQGDGKESFHLKPVIKSVDMDEDMKNDAIQTGGKLTSFCCNFDYFSNYSYAGTWEMGHWKGINIFINLFCFIIIFFFFLKTCTKSLQ